MAIGSTNTLSDEVGSFLEAVSRAKPYRMITRGEKPSEAEVRLCGAIERIPISEQEVIKVRSWLGAGLFSCELHASHGRLDPFSGPEGEVVTILAASDWSISEYGPSASS